MWGAERGLPVANRARACRGRYQIEAPAPLTRSDTRLRELKRRDQGLELARGIREVCWLGDDPDSHELPANIDRVDPIPVPGGGRERRAWFGYAERNRVVRSTVRRRPDCRLGAHCRQPVHLGGFDLSQVELGKGLQPLEEALRGRERRRLATGARTKIFVHVREPGERDPRAPSTTGTRMKKIEVTGTVAAEPAETPIALEGKRERRVELRNAPLAGSRGRCPEGLRPGWRRGRRRRRRPGW